MNPIFFSDAVQNNNHLINILISNLSTEINNTINEADSSAENENNSSINLDTAQNCGTLFDITSMIPLWVIHEKQKRQDSNQSTLTIYDFVQKYYDWLYCDGDSGAQYGLSKNLLDLIDVKKTKESLIQNLYGAYAESFSGLFQSNNLNVGRIELENFLTNIRKNFYHKKGTEEGLRKILTTLFVIDEQDIQVEIPKEYVLRLNGGKFYNQNFNFRTTVGDTGTYLEKGDLSGSYLNFSRFHSNDWFHDYSYLVYCGENFNDNDDLEDLYRKSNHPAGTHLIFGKQLSDFEPEVPESDDSTVCEFPMLKNYAPYRLGITYAGLGTINGVSFFGLNSCIGCCGASFSGFTGPTHRFPNWNGTINESIFGSINIQDFLFLCYSDGITSPNDTLTCVGCI
jgi:hypothetical protein